MCHVILRARIDAAKVVVQKKSSKHEVSPHLANSYSGTNQYKARNVSLAMMERGEVPLMVKQMREVKLTESENP